MVTGGGAFARKTAADTLSAILGDVPKPLAGVSPGAPVELEQIITKALKKERSERYQTVKELLTDLRTLKQELAFRERLNSGNLNPGHTSRR